MKLSCSNYEFNQDWDDKLKFLIENNTSYKVCAHKIVFKLKVKTYFFGLFKIYDTYSVWTSKRDCAYGRLSEFNGKGIIPDEHVFAPSEDTMKLLYALESPFDYDRIYK
jgi:hypothetical protein